jgi:ribosomal protein S18 acetylase RimI-like enzyme
MVDPAYLKVLGKIYEALKGSNINWAVTGSLSFALQGVPVEIHDIDIQTDRVGAYEIEQRFSDSVVKKIRFSSADRIRSHFGALLIDRVRVEVMGDIQKLSEDGTWEDPVELDRHKTVVEVGGMELPVLSLEYEHDAYLRLGRHDKAALLRRWLDRKSAERMCSGGKGVKVRNASLEDVRAIYDILRESFQPYRRHYTDEAYRATVVPVAEITRRLTDDQTDLLVAVYSDKVVGTVSVSVQGPDTLYIQSMAVSPGHRGKGVGREILAAVTDIGRAKRCKRIALECYEPLAEARNLYERFGFRRTGRARAYHGITVFEMVMKT